MKKLMVILFEFSFFVFFCSPYDSGEGWGDMEKMREALKKENINHYFFEKDKGTGFIVVPSFGARIIGAFIEGENLFWVHPDIKKGVGGQCTWISPEGGDKGFILKPDWSGNRDISMLDPGKYIVSSFRENKFIRLVNRFRATSNDGKEQYFLTVTREMSFAENPMDGTDIKDSDLRFLGIDFTHKLKNNGGKLIDRIIALWSLVKINPVGTVIVPVDEPSDKCYRGNYFEPLPPEYVHINSDSISFFVHGSKRYKIGINPKCAKGVIAYISRDSKNEYYMVMMRFPVDKEGKYADRPKNEQETNGDAIQIYSHLERSPLAFGDLDCHSPALYLPPNKEEAFNIKIYIFKGSRKWILKVGEKLVCQNFSKAYLFIK